MRHLRSPPTSPETRVPLTSSAQVLEPISKAGTHLTTNLFLKNKKIRGQKNKKHKTTPKKKPIQTRSSLVKTGTSLVNSLSLSLYVSLSVQISVAQKLLHKHHVFQSFETRLLDPMATPRRLFFLHLPEFNPQIQLLLRRSTDA